MGLPLVNCSPKYCMLNLCFFSIFVFFRLPSVFKFFIWNDFGVGANAITEEKQLSLISTNWFNFQLCPGSLLGLTDCFLSCNSNAVKLK